jgi:hypothetical protein
MWTSGNHKLKESIARVCDIVRFDRRHLGKLVMRADVLAIPAVTEGHLLEGLIFGLRIRYSGLIGSDQLLLE